MAVEGTIAPNRTDGASTFGKIQVWYFLLELSFVIPKHRRNSGYGYITSPWTPHIFSFIFSLTSPCGPSQNLAECLVDWTSTKDRLGHSDRIGDVLDFFGPGHGNGKTDVRGQILVAIARVSIVKLLQFFRSALPIIRASLPLSNLLVPVLPDQLLFH